MNKKTLWILLAAAAAAAALAVFLLLRGPAGLRGTPASAGADAGLSLSLTDGADGRRTLAGYSDDAGTCWFFLPAWAELRTATLLRDGEDTGLTGADLLAAAGDAQDACTLEVGGVSRSFGWRQSASLPSIWIETASGSLDAIHADKEYKEPGVLSVLGADGRTEYAGALKYIKGRGNTTWDYDKKPYAVKLEEAADLFGMGAAKSWCLLANYRDDSCVRNAIVYDFARGFGIPATTETQSADLYVNGAYLGLYQVTEKVEVGENRVDVPDLDAQNEAVNPQCRVKDCPPFSTGTEKGVRLPADPADITEGYLMELDFRDRWEEEPSGFLTDIGQAVVLKNPEYASEAEVAYARSLVQTFEDRLFADDPAYLSCIDLDSWAKLYLVEELFEDVDCGLSSIFFTVQDGKLVAGPVWDFDLTMGDSYAITNPRTLYAAWSERTERFTSTYLPRLYRQPAFRARVEALYAEYCRGALRALASDLSGYFTEGLLASAEMDELRWGKTPGAAAAQQAYLRDYLSQREEFLTSLWVGHVPYHRVRLTGNVYTRYYEYMVRDGETFGTFPALTKEGCTLEGWFTEGTDAPFDPTQPITADTFLYARWKEAG